MSEFSGPRAVSSRPSTAGGERLVITVAIGQALNANHPEPHTVTDSPIEAAILGLLAERPANTTLSPEEAARAVAGADDWHHSLTAVRRAAVGLALAGRLVIYRKGKPVDPSDFKGVYRLGLPRLD